MIELIKHYSLWIVLAAMKNRAIGPILVGNLLLLILPNRVEAADGLALLNRKHVGRVKAVALRGSLLVVEGMFHDRSFREISVRLDSGVSIINPDVMDRARPVGREAIRTGYYVALECAETGKRHAALKVTITSTGAEEKIQRALLKASRAALPGLRGTGSGPR